MNLKSLTNGTPFSDLANGVVNQFPETLRGACRTHSDGYRATLEKSAATERFGGSYSDITVDDTSANVLTGAKRHHHEA